jgi:hypothetical protein
MFESDNQKQLDDYFQGKIVAPLVSRLTLQGVAFEFGKRTMERYLGALQWTP